MIGVLPSLAERIGRPLGELELLVGTSAGSVLAAALRCGMTVDELVTHQRGEPVEGGIASVTSVDLLARDSREGLELDEVYVLAPLASHVYDSPVDPLTRIERGVRVLLTGQVDREVRAVRDAGIPVRVITPGPED